MKSNFFILNLITNCLNNFFFQFLILYFFVTGDFSLISKIVLFVAPIVFLKNNSQLNTLDLRNFLFIFLLPNVMSQLIFRGAGYFNGGFIVFVIVMVLLVFQKDKISGKF